MKRIYNLVVVLALFCLSVPAWGVCFIAPPPIFFICTLDEGDEMGTAPPPDYYICSDNLKLEDKGAGGKPDFSIALAGYCGVHSGGGLPGWTPVDWQNVAFNGRYNYETGIASEVVWDGPTDVLVANLKCKQNPWAHAPDCDFTAPLANKTGVDVTTYFPISAHFLPLATRQAIEKWEAQPAGEPLANWNPYAASGDADMEIGAPQPNQVISVNDDAFSFDAVVLSGATPTGLIFMWQEIIPVPKVVGDIALPSKATHHWKPFLGPQYATWQELPLQIPLQSGPFAGQTGLFEVQVKKASGGPWSAPVRFWVGDPAFDLPTLAKFKSKTKLKRKLILDAKKMKKPATKAPKSILKKLGPAVLKPRLQVVGIEWSAMGITDEAIDLFVRVRNDGGAVSKSGANRLYVACVPADACEALSPMTFIKIDLEPGDQEVITVPNAIRKRDDGAVFSVSTYPLIQDALLKYASQRRK